MKCFCFESVMFIFTAHSKLPLSSRIAKAMDELIAEGFPSSEIMTAQWAYINPWCDLCEWQYSFKVS